ncbi:hypothetical protein ISCGN_008124 [Ixodes scapularis]
MPRLEPARAKGAEKVLGGVSPQSVRSCPLSAEERHESYAASSMMFFLGADTMDPKRFDSREIPSDREDSELSSSDNESDCWSRFGERGAMPRLEPARAKGAEKVLGGVSPQSVRSCPLSAEERHESYAASSMMFFLGADTMDPKRFDSREIPSDREDSELSSSDIESDSVTVFGEEVTQLPSFRAWKLRVNVELRWRRTVLLRWRGFFSNRGDFGGVPKFLDVAHSCTFREVLRFLSEVRHEDHSAPILKFSYSSCDAYSSSQEQLKVAFKNNFAAGSCIGTTGTTTLDRGGRFTWSAATRTAADAV